MYYYKVYEKFNHFCKKKIKLFSGALPGQPVSIHMLIAGLVRFLINMFSLNPYFGETYQLI